MSSSSAKSGSKTKSASAKNEAGQSVETYESPRRGMGVPLVGCAASHTGPDEPQTPPMPGPQGSGRAKSGGSGACRTCRTVPFGGPMAIALLSTFLLLLSIAMLTATSLIGTQQFYLDQLSGADDVQVKTVQLN